MKLAPNKKTKTKQGMDLTKEFNDFVDEHGVYVLLIRPLTNIKCTCYSPATNEGDPSCPLCFGIGNKIMIERHKVRIASPGSNITLTDVAKALAPGHQSAEPYKVYCKNTSNVYEGMYVIWPDWDGDKPIKNINMLVIFIGNVYRPIGSGGEVNYLIGSGERSAPLEDTLMRATIKDIVVIDP